jgi:tetratricopeptide (TPR) repeat protein
MTKGAAMLKKGQVDAAQEQYLAALKIASRAGLQQRIALSWYSLALVSLKKRKYREAENTCGRMVTIAREAFGEDHSLTGLDYMLLGDCHWIQGHYKEAAASYKESFRIVRIRNRPGDEAFTEPAIKYAMALNKLGQLKEARAVESMVKSRISTNNKLKGDRELSKW